MSGVRWRGGRCVRILLAALFAAFAVDAQERRRWTVADFEPLLAVGLEGYRDFGNGRRRFHSAACADCHGFAGSEKGDAPDLSDVGSRLEPGALLAAILAPEHPGGGKGPVRPVDALDDDSVLDLLAYLLSGGREDHSLFAK